MPEGAAPSHHRAASPPRALSPCARRTSPVHLIAPGEDTFGSTTFAPGGAAIDTSLADAWITCRVN